LSNGKKNENVNVKRKVEENLELVGFVAICAIAVLTRIYGIWEWSITGDEVYTARHYEERYTNNTGPLFYYLVAICVDIFGLKEWSIRLPSVLFGVLSIPAVYLVGRQIFNKKVAAFSAVIAIGNPYTLIHAQYARYYSGVFFFGLISYYTYYISLKSKNYYYLTASVLSGLIGCLFHPTAVLIFLSCAAFSVFTLVWGGDKEYSRQVSWVYVVVCLVVLAVGSPLLVEIIVGWVELHNVTGAGIASLGLSDLVAGLKGTLRFLFGLTRTIGFPVSVGALFGLIALFKVDFRKGIFFLACTGVPVAALLSGSKVVPVSARYIFYTQPLLLILSGFVCYRVYKGIGNLGATRYVLVFSILAWSFLPFVSYYTVRAGPDAKTIVEYLSNKYSEGDRLVSIPKSVVYMVENDRPRWSLIDREENWKKRAEEFANQGHTVWMVVRTSPVPGVGEAWESWLIDNASLVKRMDRKAYVYWGTGFEVWRLDPSS
jgi:uncharacterized membrane protein